MRAFRLTSGDLDSIAGGHPSSATLALLQAGQASRQLLLLRTVVGPIRKLHQVAAGLDVMSRAGAAGASVTRVVTDPSVVAWTLRRPRGAGAANQFGAIAAVVAVRTRIDLGLTLSLEGGPLVLPSLGTWLPSTMDSLVKVLVRAGVLTAQSGSERLVLDPAIDEPVPGWRAVRHLRVKADGRELTVALADADPFLDCYGAPLAPWLTGADMLHWSRLLSDAWSLLVRCVPDRADEMSAGLRALVPLARTPQSGALSATRRGLFGALALTTPIDPAAFAATLVHERQHAILNALIDLVPLHRPSDGTTYTAPWRTDRRPINGLLHGVFAFTAVADFWKRLFQLTGDRYPARPRFLHITAQLAVGMVELEASHELTGAGRRFVQGLRVAFDHVRKPG